jgi:Calpain family cysteine protease
MLSSTIGGVDTEDIEGVVLGHAYTVLSAHKAIASSGEEALLLRIRNPWG